MRRPPTQGLGRWLLVLLALGGLAVTLLANPVPTAEDLLKLVTVLVYAGVRSDLLAVLGSTVQPASTGLWLKESAP